MLTFGMALLAILGGATVTYWVTAAVVRWPKAGRQLGAAARAVLAVWAQGAFLLARQLFKLAGKQMPEERRPAAASSRQPEEEEEEELEEAPPPPLVVPLTTP